MSNSVLSTADVAVIGGSSDPDVRAAIVRAAIAVYEHQAFHEVTLDTIAERAGLDVAVVLAHFPRLDDLVSATIQTWNGERMAPLVPLAEQYGTAAFLRAVVLANIQDPGLMRLIIAVVNIASMPDHPAAPELQRQWVHFHAMVQRALVQDVAAGREPSTMDPARGAEQLIALYEGLQIQWMMRAHMDVLGAYDRAVTRLRDGWSRPYTSPVWEI
jgi:AcrR family transcriptional regulator